MKFEDLEQLIDCFDGEIHIFKQLEEYESKKNDVIVKQNVNKLRELTKVEEELLEKIEGIEKERENVVSKILKEKPVASKKNLTNIIKQLPESAENYKELLIKKKEDLVSAIKKIKNLNHVNNRLLKDTIKFYSYSLNTLKGHDSITYNQKGDMPQEFKNSWLINKHA